MGSHTYCHKEAPNFSIAPPNDRRKKSLDPLLAGFAVIGIIVVYFAAAIALIYVVTAISAIYKTVKARATTEQRFGGLDARVNWAEQRIQSLEGKFSNYISSPPTYSVPSAYSFGGPTCEGSCCLKKKTKKSA
jgi:hypothetical protein